MKTKALYVPKAELFTDGEVYERMMGRWSRLAGEAFLASCEQLRARLREDLPATSDGQIVY